MIISLDCYRVYYFISTYFPGASLIEGIVFIIPLIKERKGEFFSKNRLN
tara:strand:- start:1622 stop:1768 length:147 start_codon:yes stop_codon:yes gene_type:complete